MKEGMKVVIDISEDDYRKVQDGRASVTMMRNAIRNGTPIPDNATNGDVIKALFPRIKIKKYPTFLRVIEGEEYIPMTYDWWNAPYKRGDKE